jgi:peroxiredoxin
MSVEVGSEAPDFTLRNENGEELTLSSLRGQNVVLLFYPLAFSRTCTRELHDISAARERHRDTRDIRDRQGRQGRLQKS